MSDVTASTVQEWILFLEANEFSFNEELHNLRSEKKRIECLPFDGVSKKHGWFLTYCDVSAGEWNLAHPFGYVDSYAPLVRAFPSGETFHLLVPKNDLSRIESIVGTDASEDLIWFIDSIEASNQEARIDEGKDFEFLSGYDFRFFDVDFQAADDRTSPPYFPRAYLLENNSVVSMVKATHVTKNSVEVYIETVPRLRDKGLGAWLLERVRARIRLMKKRMIYVVSSHNFPSLRVAEKLGLARMQILSRIAFTKAL